MSDVTDLIERLRAKDAEWQQRVDGWISTAKETGANVTAEQEAIMRSRIENEAADALERLTRPADDVPTCNMALRSAVFNVLRQHDVSEDCFAAVASIIHAALASIKQTDSVTDAVEADLTDEEQATVDFFTAAIRGAK